MTIDGYLRKPLSTTLVYKYFVAVNLKLLTRLVLSHALPRHSDNQEYNLTDNGPSPYDSRAWISIARSLTIQESSKAKSRLAVPIPAQSSDLTKTQLTFFQHPDLLLPSFHSRPQLKRSRVRFLFGELDDEKSATDPEPVREAQSQDRLPPVGVRNQTYLTLGLSWSSLSGRTSTSQS